MTRDFGPWICEKWDQCLILTAKIIGSIEVGNSIDCDKKLKKCVRDELLGDRACNLLFKNGVRVSYFFITFVTVRVCE